MPLIYFAAGYFIGWWIGHRGSPQKTAEAHSAAEVLDSVSKLAHAGALSSMDGLKLKTGDDKSGVQLLIKVRPSSASVTSTIEGIDEF